MRQKAIYALLYTGLVGGLLAAGYLAYFIWGINWGSGRRNWVIGLSCLVLLPPLVWAAIYFAFAWLASLLDET